MIRLLHAKYACAGRTLGIFLTVLVLHGLHAQEATPTKISAKERLRFIYEAIEEGSDHAQALQSVEEGLGGGQNSDRLADSMVALEKGSNELNQRLKKEWPQASSEAVSVSSSAGLLREMKAEALARLEKKVHNELTADALPPAAQGPEAADVAIETVSKRKKAAAELFNMVRQKLSELPWGYSGDSGPTHWAELGYGLCSKGELQSPVDIQTVSATTKAIDILNIDVLNWQFPAQTNGDGTEESSGTISLTYGPPKLFMDLPVNSRFADTEPRSATRSLLWWGSGPLESYNGHSFTVERLGGPTLFVDGATYKLREFHIHTPSEHTIDGARFDMEIQFVHSLSGSGGAGFVIISLMFNRGADADAPQFLRRLAAVIQNEHFGPTPKWLDRKLSFDQIAGVVQSSAHMARYFKYRGSLTQPPCTEDVTWFVIKEPLTADAASLSAFSALQGANIRPLQKLNNRIVEFTP